MRKRLLNPLLFRDEELCDVPVAARYLFTGLWCIADREGILEDRPMRIKADIFPYDDLGASMVDQWLADLHPRWIVRYEIDGKRLIWIRTFKQHQKCHKNEAKSVLPMVNLGAPLVSQRSTIGQPLVEGGSAKGTECRSVIGIQYTVNPLSPPAEEFALSAASELSSPSKVRRSKRNSTDYTPDFEGWWAIFPRKDAKVAAFKAWRSLSASDKDAAFAGINRQLPKIEERIAEKGEDGCPHGATWINQRRWEDGGINASQVFVMPNATPRPLPDRQCEIDSMNAQYEALKAKGLV